MLYFAYGSNLSIWRMSDRCKDAQPIERVTLYDYKLTFRGNRRGVGVADIIPCKGERVEGVIYAISQDDLKALDRYEGYPSLYNRHDIEVFTENSKKVKCFVYRMLDKYEPCPPDKYYFNIIRDGYKDWDIPLDGLLEARKEVIEQTA